jgi:hypothetical protein
MLIIFIDIKGIAHKELVLADQTINSSYYCDVLRRLYEVCEDFALNFGDSRTGCCITTTHRLHPPYCPLSPTDSSEVREAEHDFQDAEGDCFEGGGVSCSPDGSTSPGIYGWLFVCML